MAELKESLKKFWEFLKKDSWPSFMVSLILALIIIKFIFFPIMTLLTGTILPLVIVESCSMYHSESLDQIVGSNLYSQYGISINNTSDWVLKNGFTKGDIIFVLGPNNLKVGDVIIFATNQTPNPIIHRVVNINTDGTYATKGDHNNGFLSYEKSISKEQILGKAVFKVPVIGWIKLIFFDWKKPIDQRGFCK